MKTCKEKVSCQFGQQLYLEAQQNPQSLIYLRVGHIHASGIESVLYLLNVVNLEQVIASKLHVCELLVVFEEVNREVHLAGCASC